MRSHADRQRGLASLELVLCLPILIVLAVLALSVAQIGHRRIEMQGSARNGAYANALKLTRLASTDKEGGVNQDALNVSHPNTTATAGGDFIDTMQLRDARFGALHSAKVVPTALTAQSDFFSRPALGGWQLTVRDQHAVVAAPMWVREDLPLGYDRYLRSRLRAARYNAVLFSGNASDAMPNVFPKEK